MKYVLWKVLLIVPLFMHSPVVELASLRQVPKHGLEVLIVLSAIWLTTLSNSFQWNNHNALGKTLHEKLLWLGMKLANSMTWVHTHTHIYVYTYIYIYIYIYYIYIYILYA